MGEARDIIILGFVLLIAIFASDSTSSTARSGGSQRSSKIRSGFGEACNKTLRCKSQSWLACDSETEQCGCAKPEDMVYDNAREKCVALIGERCKYGFGADEENSGSFFEKADCVTGAACGNDGICACPNGTYEAVEENACSPLKSRGAVCQNSVECDQRISLLCLDGKCQCATDDMIFDNLTGVCTVKAGKNCILPNKDLPNLSVEEGGAHVAPCVNGSQCVLASGRCVCSQGSYLDSEAGTCLPVKPMGWYCSSSDECDRSQMLSCVNARCACDPSTSVYTTESYSPPREYYSYDYYTIKAGICVGKVGSSCKDPRWNRNMAVAGGNFCVRNSYCDFGKCTCMSNYFPTSDGLCGLRHQQQCSVSNVCSDVFRCAGPGSQTCRCPSEELQFYEDGICKGIVGGPCDPSLPEGCVKNAKCVESESAEGVFICKCRDGFVETGNSRCEIAFGSKCYPSTTDRTECDSTATASLKCVAKSNSEFRCTCTAEHDVFEKNLRKCSRAIGFTCIADENCITNAICENPWKSPRGRCRCKYGYQFNKINGKCNMDEVNSSGESTANGDNLEVENLSEPAAQEPFTINV